MPHYADSNHFDHRRDLPAWFWTDATSMNCLHHTITQSLEHAHAHHIQRLTIIGNFALLAGCVHKMSDYCDLSHYRRDKRSSDRACPFNALN